MTTQQGKQARCLDAFLSPSVLVPLVEKSPCGGGHLAFASGQIF